MDKSPLLTQLHQDFIAHLHTHTRSTNTILAYGKDIAQFLAFLHQQTKDAPSDITAATITAFTASLTDYTPKSISRKLNSIKAFCRFLHQNHHLAKDPARHVSSPSLTTTPPRILTPLEYRALRDAARTNLRLAAIVELLLQSGLRIGELANLELDDFSKDLIQFTIRPYQSRTGRTVPFTPATRVALRNYLKDRPRTREKIVFVTKTGRPFLVRNVRSGINRLFRKAGIKDATVNDLRHTFIAVQIAAGTPLNFIAEVVGHKRLTTTENYLKYVKPGPSRSDPKLEEL